MCYSAFKDNSTLYYGTLSSVVETLPEVDGRVDDFTVQKAINGPNIDSLQIRQGGLEYGTTTYPEGEHLC